MGDQRDGITTFDSFLSRICNLHSVWYGADVVLTLGKRRAPGSVMEFCTLQARKEPRAGNFLPPLGVDILSVLCYLIGQKSGHTDL